MLIVVDSLKRILYCCASYLSLLLYFLSFFFNWMIKQRSGRTGQWPAVLLHSYCILSAWLQWSFSVAAAVLLLTLLRSFCMIDAALPRSCCVPSAPISMGTIILRLHFVHEIPAGRILFFFWQFPLFFLTLPLPHTARQSANALARQLYCSMNIYRR